MATRIAVTGGGGFIGAAVVARALEVGADAWRFDRVDGCDILGDLGGLKGADVIIHLAGALGTSELFDSAEAAVDANVKGTIRILDWCRQHGAAYVGITMPDSNWANVYQATKLCSMRLATAWYRNFGVPVSHVRAFNAYGPGQKYGPGHPQKLIPTFATKAWAGEPLPIWGDGLQTVDLVHVDDVAKMLVDAVAFGNDEVFEAGTGIPVTVRTVARFINRTCNVDETNVEYLPMRPGEANQSTVVSQRSTYDDLGWRPRLDWSLVEKAVEWYKPRD